MKIVIKVLALVVMIVYIIYAPGGELAWIWKDNPMEVAIAIGVGVFVAVYIGGLRIMAKLEAHKATRERLRRLSVTNRAKDAYTGGYFNAHGNEVED